MRADITPWYPSRRRPPPSGRCSPRSAISFRGGSRIEPARQRWGRYSKHRPRRRDSTRQSLFLPIALLKPNWIGPLSWPALRLSLRSRLVQSAPPQVPRVPSLILSTGGVVRLGSQRATRLSCIQALHQESGRFDAVGEASRFCVVREPSIIWPHLELDPAFPINKYSDPAGNLPPSAVPPV